MGAYYLLAMKKSLPLLLLPAFALAHETGVPHDEACGFVAKNLSAGYYLAFGFLAVIAAFGFFKFFEERKKERQDYLVVACSWHCLAFIGSYPVLRNSMRLRF